MRRFATLYPDTVIAGILNRQGRTTAHGHRFEGNRVANLRTYWKIPCFVPKADVAEGELLTIKRAAIALGVAPSTIHRLLNDGIIAGEQITPGAPWRIRLSDGLKARFNAEAGDGDDGWEPDRCRCGTPEARPGGRRRFGCHLPRMWH